MKERTDARKRFPFLKKQKCLEVVSKERDSLESTSLDSLLKTLP